MSCLGFAGNESVRIRMAESYEVATFCSITTFAKQLDVARRIAPALRERNDVIKFKLCLAVTTDASSTIALPNKRADVVRNKPSFHSIRICGRAQASRRSFYSFASLL